MASSKISDLAAFSVLDLLDLIIGVDVSDLSMATSGTDKKATLAQLLAFIQAQPKTVNAQVGTSYTFVLGDANNIVTGNNASFQTFTIPLNASVAYPVGTQIIVIQLGAGKIGFLPSGLAVVYQTTGQGAVVTLTKYASPDSWNVSGSIATYP